MGIDRKTFLTCDRCGEQIEVSDTVAMFDISADYPGWARIDGDRALCPVCAPGYELIKARQLVELENYVAGGGPDGERVSKS